MKPAKENKTECRHGNELPNNRGKTRYHIHTHAHSHTDAYTHQCERVGKIEINKVNARKREDEASNKAIQCQKDMHNHSQNIAFSCRKKFFTDIFK